MTNMLENDNALIPEPRRPVPPAPIHPLAALVTIVLDNIFGWFEIIDPLAILFTSFVVGGVGFITTLFVQRYLAKDEWGPSAAKGLVMGVLAGVPFQVTGTAVGAILLGWAGANKWVKISPHQPEEQPSDLDKIVDLEPKQ
jgi:hypothetical protein